MISNRFQAGDLVRINGNRSGHKFSGGQLCCIVRVLGENKYQVSGKVVDGKADFYKDWKGGKFDSWRVYESDLTYVENIGISASDLGFPLGQQ